MDCVLTVWAIKNKDDLKKKENEYEYEYEHIAAILL